MKSKLSVIAFHLLILLPMLLLFPACQEEEPWQEGLYFLKGEDQVVRGSLIYTTGKNLLDDDLPKDLVGAKFSVLPDLVPHIFLSEAENNDLLLGSCTFGHPLEEISYASESLAEKTRDHIFSIDLEDNYRIRLRLLYEPGEVRDIYNAFFSIFRHDSLVEYHYFGSAAAPLRADTFRIFDDHLTLTAILNNQFGIGKNSIFGIGPYVLRNADSLHLINLWNGWSVPGEFAPLQPGRLDSLIGRSFTYGEEKITFQKVSLDNPDTDFTVPSQQYYVRLQELNGPAARLRLAFASDDGQHLILTNNRFNTASPTDEQLQPSIILPFDSIRFDQN
jgi:hypothetical protein